MARAPDGPQGDSVNEGEVEAVVAVEGVAEPRCTGAVRWH